MIKYKDLKKDIRYQFNESHKDQNKTWDKDNQAWWDWYVTLADNKNSRIKDTLLELPEPSKIKYPSHDDLKRQLSRPYTLTMNDIETFRKNGFIKLKKIFTPNVIQVLRFEILYLLRDKFKNYDVSKKNRFLSLEMMWLENSVIREFVLSSRIAKICADLLAVKKIRLYHDNALVKESGCGRTPWHFDDHHFL